MDIAVASGKGGAGKTSLSVLLASHFGAKAQIIDCDVDASNAFILLEKERKAATTFESGSKFYIHAEDCTACGACANICRFEAVSKRDNRYKINPLKCEGCGLCQDVCPDSAIEKLDNTCGEYYSSSTHQESSLIHAHLFPGEDNSGKLVMRLKTYAREISPEIKNRLRDCPPGIGCPTIASLTGSDLLIVLIEASESGFHDAMRLVEVAEKLRLEMVAVINKAGLNTNLETEIDKFLTRKNIPLIGKVPFDARVHALLKQGKSWADCLSSDLTKIFTGICNNVEQMMTK